MTVEVQILEKLERKITLNLPVSAVETEVSKRLQKLARTVKMDGFRPGKVPLSTVAQRYGYSVQYEVINDQVGQAFTKAIDSAKLRIAGAPKITEAENAPEGELLFDATFEVYPEVNVGDLSNLSIEKVNATVSQEAIDKTVEILRKQRRTFAVRSKDAAAQDGDRLSVDFEGKIDAEAFAGGSAKDFQFILGEGQMLAEFENAARGMKAGESKTFPLVFPADYHGKDVAGKTADFMLTVNKIEAAHLPEINDALAKSLGVENATVEGLRVDIEKNLQREVSARVLARNKSAVMDALVAQAQLELPTVSVQNEIARMVQNARNDLKQRGIKDADKAPIPEDLFKEQAQRRVRLGLAVAEVVKANQLHATKEQLLAHIDNIAASYEHPQDIVKWYTSDTRRMNEVEAVVIENNVTEFILSKAKVTEKTISFDDLMGTSA